MADRGLDLKRLCEYLNQEAGISWQNIHAKILARSVLLPPCRRCAKRVTIADLRQCDSHLKQPRFTKGAYIGLYPCCGRHVVKNAESATITEKHIGTSTRNSSVLQVKEWDNEDNAQENALKKKVEQSRPGKVSKKASAGRKTNCTEPQGCLVQDHVVDETRLSGVDRQSLQYLRTVSTNETRNVFEDLNQKSPFIQLVQAFIESKVMDAHIPGDLSRDMRDSMTRAALKKTLAGSGPSKADALRFVYDVIEQAEDDDSDFDFEEFRLGREAPEFDKEQWNADSALSDTSDMSDRSPSLAKQQQAGNV